MYAHHKWIIEEERRATEYSQWSIHIRSLAITHISSVHCLSLLSAFVHHIYVHLVFILVSSQTLPYLPPDLLIEVL